MKGIKSTDRIEHSSFWSINYIKARDNQPEPQAGLSPALLTYLCQHTLLGKVLGTSHISAGLSCCQAQEGCSVSQPHTAPREPMNPVTNLNKQMSRAGVLLKPLLAAVQLQISAFLQGTPAPALEGCPGCALRAGMGSWGGHG